MFNSISRNAFDEGNYVLVRFESVFLTVFLTVRKECGFVDRASFFIAFWPSNK